MAVLNCMLLYAAILVGQITWGHIHLFLCVKLSPQPRITFVRPGAAYRNRIIKTQTQEQVSNTYTHLNNCG